MEHVPTLQRVPNLAPNANSVILAAPYFSERIVSGVLGS